jgi:hypothetical protein
VALYTATSPEPRAWDFLFSKPHVTGLVRMQLMNDKWKAGLWADSYASGYGEEDADLYISSQILVYENGNVWLDSQGRLKELGMGLLIRWSEIRYLEFTEWIDNNNEITVNDDRSGDG